MIPKKIHYCWFGQGKMPRLAHKCIASWKKHCPDYEIIEWNESNFDIHKNAYTEMCIAERKYAFLSDYARLCILEEHGGFYFDIDVELLRPIDSLRAHTAYFCFESDEYVNTGIGFGSIAHSEAIHAMLAEYEPLLDGKHGTVGCPTLNTQALVHLGLEKNGKLQQLAACTVYPAEWFNPYDDATGRIHKTANTMSIHWYSKCWKKKSTILRSKLTKPLHRLLGTDFFRRSKN